MSNSSVQRVHFFLIIGLLATYRKQDFIHVFYFFLGRIVWSCWLQFVLVLFKTSSENNLCFCVFSLYVQSSYSFETLSSSLAERFSSWIFFFKWKSCTQTSKLLKNKNDCFDTNNSNYNNNEMWNSHLRIFVKYCAKFGKDITIELFHVYAKLYWSLVW